MRGQFIGLFVAKKFWVFLVQVLRYLAALAILENYFSRYAPCLGARITDSGLGLWSRMGIADSGCGVAFWFQGYPDWAGRSRVGPHCPIRDRAVPQFWAAHPSRNFPKWVTDAGLRSSMHTCVPARIPAFPLAKPQFSLWEPPKGIFFPFLLSGALIFIPLTIMAYYRPFGIIFFIVFT
jgi:hypothetical protein